MQWYVLDQQQAVCIAYCLICICSLPPASPPTLPLKLWWGLEEACPSIMVPDTLLYAILLGASADCDSCDASGTLFCGQ